MVVQSPPLMQISVFKKMTALASENDYDYNGCWFFCYQSPICITLLKFFTNLLMDDLTRVFDIYEIEKA